MELEQLKERVKTQSYAINEYQKRIFKYQENLEKILKNKYPAPQFQTEVRKIFKELLNEEVLTGQS